MALNVQRLQGASDDDLRKAFKNLGLIIDAGNRARECVDAARLCCQLLVVRTRPFLLDDAVLAKPFAVVFEPNTSRRLRWLCFALCQMAFPADAGALQPTRVNQVGDELGWKLLARLVFGQVVPRQLRVDNTPLVVDAVLAEDDRSSIALPVLAMLAATDPALLGVPAMERIESKIEHWLCQASTFSAPPKPTTSSSFWRPLSTTQGAASVVTEIDGDSTRGFFTVLNYARRYRTDQVINVTVFSMLYPWLRAQFCGPNKRAISHGLATIVVKYCERLIAQAELLSPATPSYEQQRPFVESVLLEVVRLLDLLCQIDPALVETSFYTVKNIDTLKASRSCGLVLLAVLQFYVNHGSVVDFDSRSAFRHFFQSFLNRNYTDALNGFGTFSFCVRNERFLLEKSNVFSLYFPSLLKLLAWYPQTFAADTERLLPVLVGPSSLIELTHLLLDLPVLASALEFMLRTHKIQAIRDGMVVQHPPEYHAMFNYILRNESGVSINFWSSPETWAMLVTFCRNNPVTQRVVAAANVVPGLLRTLLDLALFHADTDTLSLMVGLVLERTHQLCPMPAIQRQMDDTRQALLDALLAFCEREPALVATHSEQIVETLATSASDPDPAKEVVCTHLIWMLGEHVATEVHSAFTPALQGQVYETLELFAYEKMAAVKQDAGAVSPVLHRLLQVVISAITKLAARKQDLIPRALLCLSKLVGPGGLTMLPDTVRDRAAQSIHLLKMPSVASVMFGPGARPLPPGDGSHVSRHSTLGMALMQPAVGDRRGRPALLV